MTVSVYAAAVFTYGTIAVGAWAGHLATYLASMCRSYPWSRWTFCGAFIARENQ
jgi:hypothetical protein